MPNEPSGRIEIAEDVVFDVLSRAAKTINERLGHCDANRVVMTKSAEGLTWSLSGRVDAPPDPED